MVQIKMKNQDFPKCQASEGREVQLGLHRGEVSVACVGTIVADIAVMASS